MPHLTYTFKLLQTGGKKGKALHEAMSRWTTAHREFLDLCAERLEDLETAAIFESKAGPRRSKLAIQKWVRQNIKELPSYQNLESSMKDSLIAHFGEQLLSYLELREVQHNAGMPSGRGASDLQFDQYIQQFIGNTWIGDGPTEGQDDEFVRVQGKVQGYRPKQPYTPISFCRYDSTRNYCIVRSEDGACFALLYLLPTKEGTGFKRNGGRLTVVGKQEELKRVPASAILAPLATSKWVVRHLEQHQPETSKLIFSDGDFYLHVAFAIPDSEVREPLTILGVDRGKNRLASIGLVTLDGRHVIHKETVEGFGLHRKKIKDISARIARAQASGQDYRYRFGRINDEAAHTIANHILYLARKYKSKIVLEDLKSMMHTMMAQGRTNFSKGRKSNIYALLLRDLEYKAAAQGIRVEQVSAAYTSQTCPLCGIIDKRNRLTETVGKQGGKRVSRLRFKCVGCGFSDDDADSIAGVNIARKSVFRRACAEAKKKGNSLTWRDFAREICSG